jgi:hypothetical protein
MTQKQPGNPKQWSTMNRGEGYKAFLDKVWDNCDPKYAKWRQYSDGWGRLKAKYCKEMEEILTEEERNILISCWDREGRFWKAALEAKVPIGLAERFLKHYMSMGFMGEIPTNATPLEEFSLVQKRILAELKRRTATFQRRKKMSLEECANVLKVCRENIVSLRTMDAPDREQRPEIITHMPFEEEDEKPN